MESTPTDTGKQGPIQEDQDVLDILERVRRAIGTLMFETIEYGIKYGRLYAISGAASARGGTEDDLRKVDEARDALYALLGIRKLEQE